MPYTVLFASIELYNMKIFHSSFGSIELTEERKRHILFFHPETQSYSRYFSKTLSSPDVIRRSKHDPKVLIFYKQIRAKKYLAITVKTNHRLFILTAYTSFRIQHTPFI